MNLKTFAFALAFSFGCGARPAPPIQSGFHAPAPIPERKEETGEEKPLTEKNRLYYFRRGCDEIEIRNFQKKNAGKTEKEKRRVGNVYMWEVACGDGRIMRCSQRHVLKCSFLRKE